MLPALGETSWLAAVVESERSVAGDVLCRNGHMVLDWRRRASMMGNGGMGQSERTGGCEGHLEMSEGGKLRRERMVGAVSECADTNHFICGIENQTKRPASASNAHNLIGSAALPCRHHLRSGFDCSDGSMAGAIRVRGTDVCRSARGGCAGHRGVVSAEDAAQRDHRPNVQHQF